jgi:hypothetical protein
MTLATPPVSTPAEQQHEHENDENHFHEKTPYRNLPWIAIVRGRNLLTCTTDSSTFRSNAAWCRAELCIQFGSINLCGADFSQQ